MQEGDVIYVAQGANVPCVLRPVPGKSHYLFVGTAYVCGLMDGELFDEKITKKKKEDMEWHLVDVK